MTPEERKKRRELLQTLGDTVWEASRIRLALGEKSPEYARARERVDAARDALRLTNER